MGKVTLAAPVLSVIIIQYGGDWEGLYIDGVLVEQDHTIIAEHLARALKIPLQYKYTEIGPDGDIPHTLEDYEKLIGAK